METAFGVLAEGRIVEQCDCVECAALIKEGQALLERFAELEALERDLSELLYAEAMQSGRVKEANALARWAWRMVQRGPEGQQIVKRTLNNEHVSKVNLDPNIRQNILVHNNTNKPAPQGVDTALQFLDPPVKHIRAISQGRVNVTDPTHQEVSSAAAQQGFRHMQRTQGQPAENPLAGSKLITTETSSVPTSVPNTGEQNWRNVVTYVDGQPVATTPAPGKMHSIFTAENQPVSEAVSFVPHETEHLLSRLLARAQGREKPDRNVHVLGREQNVPVSYKATEEWTQRSPADKLRTLATEFNAIAASRTKATEWAKSNVPDLSVDKINAVADQSMLSSAHGYFHKERLNEMRTILSQMPLSPKEADELTQVFSELRRQYPHLPKEYTAAIDEILRMIRPR